MYTETEQHLAFKTVITVFTTAPADRHFDHEWQVIVDTDASDYVSAGVLLQ